MDRAVPNSIMGVLMKRGKPERRHPQRDGHEKMEGEIRAMLPQAKKHQGWQQPTEAGRSEESFSEPQREHGPAMLFWPLEL